MHRREGTYELALGKDRYYLRNKDSVGSDKNQWIVDRHCHAEFELHMILQGACDLNVAEEHIVLQTGDAIIIGPGQYHAAKQRPGDFERFSLALMAFGDSLQEQIRPYRRFYITKELDALCRRMYYEMEAANSFREEMLQGMMTVLMIGLLRQLQHSDGRDARVRKISEKARTDVIDDFFEKHFAEKAGAELLAQQLHLSQRQLSRVIQSLYGMGFYQKLICTRMDHAAWLLRTTPKKAGEIGSLVGYSSEAAFFKVFHEHFGMTPLQYRASMRIEK